jgi:hypothetical protein
MCKVCKDLDSCTWQQLLPVLVRAWQGVAGTCNSIWRWELQELLLHDCLVGGSAAASTVMEQHGTGIACRWQWQAQR